MSECDPGNPGNKGNGPEHPGEESGPPALCLDWAVKVATAELYDPPSPIAYVLAGQTIELASESSVTLGGESAPSIAWLACRVTGCQAACKMTSREEGEVPEVSSIVTASSERSLDDCKKLTWL